MWQPANKSALPSPADLNHAIKAISELEDALKDALAVLEQAQSRVLALTKELDDRNAWIAPIRKLPTELLSKIFIFGSEMEHLAPVTITEVSRLWRAVVLATPRAWSSIYVSKPEHEGHLDQYVSTFVERSNPCLLHIWIRGDDYDADSDESEFDPLPDRASSLLKGSLSRIQCLSIGSWQLRKLSEECMPNLARLTITDLGHDLGNDISPFFISGDRFPRLQSIQSMGCPWGDSMSLAPFPPLQELAIQINDHPTWLDVVKNCSITLKVLVLAGHLKSTERTAIIFPRLLCLTLIDGLDVPEPAEWSMTMVTPHLISYAEFLATSTAPRHIDVKSVTHLQTNHVPDLSPYVSLRVLQLLPVYPSTYVLCASKLAEQLEKDNQCPALELAQFHVPTSREKDVETEPNKRRIIEKMTRARPGIEVLFTKSFGPMPGSMYESQCGPDMPCSPERAYVEDE